jgi:DNA-binding CsgD family transcriptional regulator/PAS domain-containing protein
MPTPIVRDAIVTMRPSVPEKRRRVVIHSYDAPRPINFLWGRRLVLGLVDRAMSRRLCDATRNLDRRSAAPHADTTVTGGTPMPLAPERLSDLIGLIYDCTIEPDRWPETMHQICDDLGCFLSAIYRVDLESAQVSFLRQWNAQLDRLALLEKYGPDVTRIYQTMQAVRNRQIDEPLVLSRHVAREAWVQSRYYTEWAKPRGVCDSIQTMVLRESRRIGIFAANRHETVGPVSDREVAILRLLAPHIRRAVTIGDLMDLKKVEVQALESTLDHLSAGVIVVAEGNRILHANQAARRMFAAGSPVRSLSGRLAARGAAAGAELAKAIDLARRNESGIGAAGIGVPLAGELGEPAVAHVLPLARGDLRTRLVPQATAAVFVTRAEQAPPAKIDAVAATFGLTPAETRVLERLLRGTSLVEAAAALGIAETTAKTHLSRIFAKTGVSRQAELVALVHRLTPPLQRES